MFISPSPFAQFESKSYSPRQERAGRIHEHSQEIQGKSGVKRPNKRKHKTHDTTKVPINGRKTEGKSSSYSLPRTGKTCQKAEIENR